MYGTGRIGEIIDYLETTHKKSIIEIPIDYKINILCESLGLNNLELDDLIYENSPVMRTVKGHAFETFFDHLILDMGYDVTEVGGDDSVDRIVNDITLQLKTPTMSGTRGNFVQYKTHKTHGAKSETESVNYYSKVNDFADYLVGLIEYNPLKIIFIHKSELPLSNISREHIKSPFTIDWSTHPGLNNFSRIGVKQSNFTNNLLPSFNEILPKTSSFLNLSSEVIIDTFLKKENFRMWDMAVRGFAREKSFELFCIKNNITLYNPSVTGRERYDKADHVIYRNGNPVFLQMKGISTNNCCFDLSDPIIATETQLTRGRVNDHPTQSRLYLCSDFDFLILAIDPPIASICRKRRITQTEFYQIPTNDLDTHSDMPHRLKSLQKFKFSEIQKYKI
ncbi:hypothetical protein O4N80_01195 [Vibrio parahaemolyticus]|uniref:hypothetical protein n=1 Tax=Vibrio parahaemolyticus TaxID=670 RepID=UPI0022B52922|nr:hypothetical protein [Vibrio parahaemolyticus]MCZ6382454.1 hypothetical protein [Vibrio parahaemolyticus]